MNKYLLQVLINTFLFGATCLAQDVQPTTVQVSKINNITSSTRVIDNRSTFVAQNTVHTFCGFGTGTWSATIQYSDTSAAGPWTNFGDTTAAISNTSTLSTCGSSLGSVGGGTGYHAFIRFNIAGTVNISYTGQKTLWIPFNLGLTQATISALWTGSGCGTTTNALLLNGNCGGGGGSGITSLNGLTASSQIFSNDVNVTINSSGSTHQIGWSGFLGAARGGLNVNASSFNGVLKMSGGSASTAASADIYGLWPGGCISGQGLAYGGTCFSAGTGTMTSAALTLPSWLSVAGSPITTTGTFNVTPTTGQVSHQVIGTCGSGTTFAPCSLVAADLPTVTSYLDTLCSTQGSVLYRGASSWSCLGPSTAGYVLTTNGVSANPDWAPQSGGGGGALNGQRTASTLSDAFLTTDAGKEVDRTYTTGACSESLSSAATSGFVSPWASFIQNDCLGALTITATTSVFILPAGTTTSNIILSPGQGVSIWSDSTNYHVNGTWLTPANGITIANNQVAVDSTYVQTNNNEQSGKTITLTETTSSATVYGFSMSPALSAYPTDASHIPLMTWHVAHSCTGGTSTTGNISTLGAVAIVIPGGNNPASADCVAGIDLVLSYDAVFAEGIISSATAANPMVLTFASTPNAIIVGSAITISGASGTGCSGMNGSQTVSAVLGTSVTISFNGTTCTYSASSASATVPSLVIVGGRSLSGGGGGGTVTTTGSPSSPQLAKFSGSTSITTATAHDVKTPLACSDSSGSGTAQFCSTSPTFTPAAGDTIIYSTTTQNTGDLTINVNSSSAVHVRKWQGASVLAAGDSQANIPFLLTFDGTYWEMYSIGNPPGVSYATTGYPYWIFGMTTGATATTPNGPIAHTVTCWSTIWNIDEVVASIGGVENSSVTAHYAIAFYKAGNLVAQTVTNTGQNLTTPSFVATFASPPTISRNSAIDVCFTTDNTNGQMMGILDPFNGNWAGHILTQGGLTNIFTAANVSTGTTTLVFPATLGAKTTLSPAGNQGIPPILAAIQN